MNILFITQISVQYICNLDNKSGIYYTCHEIDERISFEKWRNMSTVLEHVNLLIKLVRIYWDFVTTLQDHVKTYIP